VTSNAILSHFRPDEPMKSVHHVQTMLGERPVKIDITDVTVNAPVPGGTFDVPTDVRALREKRSADAAESDKAAKEPSLRRQK
jgi:hypothetical protein